MKIEDVLKNEDKAIPVYQEKNRFSNVYASLDDGGVLWWHSMESDERLEPVPLAAINEKEWGAYHEVKEIRPKKGEVWKFKSNAYPHYIIEEGGVLHFTWIDGGSQMVERSDIPLIHNKNGWTRLFPEVEDDSVERIEIEEVEFVPRRLLEGGTAYIPVSKGGFAINNDIALNPPMKMILERSKI